MMAQNATVRPSALQVRECVQAALAEEGEVAALREGLCCAERSWDEVEDGGVPGLVGVCKGVREERERVRSCLMGVAQGRVGSGCERRSWGDSAEREGDVEEGAAAPDVPREKERVRADSISDSVAGRVRGWGRAFGRVRSGP